MRLVLCTSDAHGGQTDAHHVRFCEVEQLLIRDEGMTTRGKKVSGEEPYWRCLRVPAGTSEGGIGVEMNSAIREDGTWTDFIAIPMAIRARHHDFCQGTEHSASSRS